jgi:hypothetical protein
MSVAAIARLTTRLFNLVGLGRLKVVDDSGDQQKIQVIIREGGPIGETIDKVRRVGHYGLAYNPPEGSEVVVLFVGGHRSSGVAIATGKRETRFKDLAPGEVQLGNQETDSWIFFAADGKVRIKGDVEITGALTTTKDIIDNAPANAVTVKQLRDAYDAHKHTGVQAGAGTSGLTDHPVP